MLIAIHKKFFINNFTKHQLTYFSFLFAFKTCIYIKFFVFLYCNRLFNSNVEYLIRVFSYRKWILKYWNIVDIIWCENNRTSVMTEIQTWTKPVNSHSAIRSCCFCSISKCLHANGWCMAQYTKKKEKKQQRHTTLM